MTIRKPTLRWRRWHRWLGVLAALPLVILAITGVLLNHLDAFGWSAKPVTPTIARWYGVDLPQTLQGVELQGQWFARVNDQLYWQDRLVGDCRDSFQGVTEVQGLAVAGCAGDTLLLLDAQGRVQESMGAAYGVPRFSRLGLAEGFLMLETSAGVVQFDVDQLLASARPGAQPAWVQWQPLPGALTQSLIARSVPSGLTWERLLLDIHAGRILGLAGQLVMDLAALILVVLVVTGTVIWNRRGRR